MELTVLRHVIVTRVTNDLLHMLQLKTWCTLFESDRRKNSKSSAESIFVAIPNILKTNVLRNRTWTCKSGSTHSANTNVLPSRLRFSIWEYPCLSNQEITDWSKTLRMGSHPVNKQSKKVASTRSFSLLQRQS